MILVDSSIWIYALNPSSPKYDRARDFLTKNIPQIVISQQNILETLRVLTHPKFQNKVTLEVAISATRVLTTAVMTIFPLDQALLKAIDLIKKYHLSSDQIFDAYLVATALSWGIDTIATDNTKDFSLMKEIKVINPFSS